MPDEQLSILGDITPVMPVEPKIPAVKKKTISPRKETPTAHHGLDFEKVYSRLITGIRAYFQEAQMKRGILGVSGGIDSALTLKLAVDALGPENITALILPELGVTSQENIDHAKALCQFFKIGFHYIPINPMLISLALLPWKPSKLAMMNARARVRMGLLYNFANTNQALVLGTSNRSELLLGYGTKFGDLACDIEVIGDLYKTEVIALADFVGLPPEIVHKTPTAELSSGQTDEADLGASYKDLDQVLMKLGLGLDGAIGHGLPPTLVHDVFRRVSQNAHKTKLPPVIPVR